MTPQRATALLVSTVVSVALAFAAHAWWDRRRAEDLVLFEPDFAALAAKRVIPEDRPYFVTEDEAKELYGFGARPTDGRRYDPWCGMHSEPGLEELKRWRDHPDGKFRIRTNSEGLRDRELDRDAAFDLRVIAAGDSHTFGLCNEDESWPGRLEHLLGERWPDLRFEVLNTGQGGFTFYNYLGMLEKYLDWEPDVFVLAAFAGNDFAEMRGLAHFFGEAEEMRLPPDEARQLHEITDRVSLSALGQCFNSIMVFNGRPEWVEVTLELSLALVSRMKALCDERGVLFVLAVIPAPCGMDWGADVPPAIRGALDQLGLSAGSCDLIDDMTDRFLAGVAALGVTVADPRRRFAGLPVPPYWRRDLHLDVEGHRVLAEQILPELAQLLD